MLIITRKLGEGLNIGKHLIITILNIDYVDQQIKLGVNGSECITIDKRKSKVISDGITITVMRIGSKQVKLGINAPENMKIHRNKAQRKNTHLKTKYLTNREGIPNQQLQGKKMSKILIVDDNPDTCNQLMKFLVEMNHSILVSHDGTEAIEKTKKLKPDIIILDLLLGKTGGMEVLKQIRQFDKRVGIIMISALKNEIFCTESLEVGADMYITKPVDYYHLATNILPHLVNTKQLN